MQIFLLVRKLQIRKFLGSFSNRKSANFWSVSVHKSQIRKFVMINPQIANQQDPDPHWFASNIILFTYVSIF